MNREVRIKQIIPANGAIVVLSNDDGTESQFPVMCWALREEVFTFPPESPETDFVHDTVIGMIIMDDTNILEEVDGPDLEGTFVRYLNRGIFP